ncbi:MAG: hypothetical protein WC413_01520 [Candidatus Nanoarchaeia archaeon]
MGLNNKKNCNWDGSIQKGKPPKKSNLIILEHLINKKSSTIGGILEYFTEKYNFSYKSRTPIENHLRNFIKIGIVKEDKYGRGKSRKYIIMEGKEPFIKIAEKFKENDDILIFVNSVYFKDCFNNKEILSAISDSVGDIKIEIKDNQFKFKNLNSTLKLEKKDYDLLFKITQFPSSFKILIKILSDNKVVIEQESDEYTKRIFFMDFIIAFLFDYYHNPEKVKLELANEIYNKLKLNVSFTLP